jgi:capsular exopolysaccharide synthesis family protein
MVPEKRKGRLTKFILGNMISAFLIFALAMIIEYRNHSFKRAREIEAELRVPLLEVIPCAEKEAKSGGFRVKKGSTASDRFFKVASRILAVRTEGEAQVLLITSSLRQEGKTFAVLNLAVAAVELGYKVLAVDANFRRPSMHTALNLKAKGGLVDILTGSAAPESVVKKTAWDKLSVITSGENPESIAGIFNAANLSNALAELKKTGYDVILIDSAAVNPYVDSTLIAGVADSAILVVEADKTQKESVFIAKKTIEERCRILGALLNGMHYYIPQALYDFLVSLHIS